jgi:hypothetical protein
MFILYIRSLYPSYIFQCHIHHHQDELVCHLLTTRYRYEAINYSFYSSYVVNYKRYNCAYVGRDSSVGIATGYGLYGPEIESRWGARLFAHVQTGPEAHPASCTMGTGFFPGVNRPVRGVDHPPPSSAKVKKE